jgi:hypothetical protein
MHRLAHKGMHKMPITAGNKAIAIGPNAKAVGKGGCIIDSDSSGNILISGDNNHVIIPASTSKKSVAITGDNNQIKKRS